MNMERRTMAQNQSDQGNIRNLEFCRTWLTEELDDVMLEYGYSSADDAW
jgi:hypothetical protein